ncbi:MULTISPECIES: glycosyltransferase [unclassified Lentimonas]|uniref:glycosyltransferase family 2 protein n=1 Tax=unclassified Lentimonas TaxID=2630993 RepID=UPI00132284F9|nr:MULTISPECIES: glycosyltransferase [unclassified Lentimonas]CAA6678756.1 Unannotated [Lentimonas sp. CC4]CAA6683742.1 Unannotated [Lentimonas sp. CC6]CAA7074410.1 Unannotated [Lentimonas sp. CC4]CAA7169020.1 Unannotated [Lentimonas sp. CC21]CAA7180573.1 Unannotated [Lentimonas sp. CC8]
MKISVLINNYNYASFITECLDSVQAQSYPIHEVIVVDDGSKDDSIERIKAHPLSPTCIEKENGGQYSAMQVATQIASGDIFCYLDSDDTWSPDYLKNVATAFESEHRPDFVYTSLEMFGNNHGPHHLNSKIDQPQFIPKSQQLLLIRRTYLGAPTSANSIKARYARQLFKDASPKRLNDYRICADQILVLGSSLIGCSKLQLPGKLVNYRVHGDNSFHNKEPEKSEQDKDLKRFLELREHLADQQNIELHPKELFNEFDQLLKAGNRQPDLVRIYSKSYPRHNISPFRKWCWKRRFKLRYCLLRWSNQVKRKPSVT